MKKASKFLIFTWFVIYSQITKGQQVSDPTTNIPATAVVPAPSGAYPGLYNNVNTIPVNYVREWTPDQPVSQYNSNIKFRQSTSFFDGLGRSLQTVKKKGHSDGYDLIQHFHYDAFGRENVQYLPYVNQPSNPNGNYDIYSKTGIEFFYPANHGQQPYSKTEYDNSPLNRVTKVMAPGKSWVGAGRGVESGFNFNGDGHYTTPGINPSYYITKGSFPRWTYNGSTVIYSDNYANETLVIKSRKDEDGNYHEEIHDVNGKLLAKRILARRMQGLLYPALAPAEIFPVNFDYTFYVYDDLDRLRAVLPPGAATSDLNVTMSGSTRTYNYTWSVTSSQLEGLAYIYKYDKRNRLIEKKIPGKEVEFFVYDKRDRLVLTQDGKLRQSGQWYFTFYDGFNRPLSQGLLALSGSRNDVQLQVTPETPGIVNMFMWQYYVRNFPTGNTADLYPTNVANATILTFNYYDNYTGFNAASFDAAKIPPSTDATVVPSVMSSSIKGLLTGTKVKILDPDNPGANDWITTTHFYDKNGRIIQSHQNNHKRGSDVLSALYYFQGMPYRNVEHHSNPESLPVPGAVTALNNIQLDTRYRRNLGIGGGNDLVWHTQQTINNAFVNNVGYYDYDHMNRLVVKQIGGAHVLQEYNIRGMLNNIHARSSSNQSKTFFKETLHYDDGFASKLYNGNIAGITWNNYNTDNNAKKHAYGYSYDKLGRLTHAEYRNNFTTPALWQKNLKDYTASNITYDERGNILTMDQRGNTTSGPIDMDKLTYQYAVNSNTLVKVSDAVTAAASAYLPDFKDNANHPLEYEYDVNGNLLTDANKDMLVTYNHFNKPERITMGNGSTITYVYDAAGNRLQKKVMDMDAGGDEEIWDYIGNFVYKDNVLQYVMNEEGRSRPKAVTSGNQQGATGFVADYFIKDHLGNVRTTLTSNPSTLEYYAEHELATANTEQLLFENIALVRDDKPGSTNPNDSKAAKLIGGDPEKMIGTAIMLRVMPGDRFTLAADAYHESEEEVPGEESAPAESVISALLTTLAGGTMGGKPFNETGNFSRLQGAMQRPEYGTMLQNIFNDAYSGQDNAPRAGLTYLVLDEEMNLTASSGNVPVSPQSGLFTNIQKGELLVTFPGYLVVFVNNTQFGKDVWFDNVQIIHHTTEVLEESHYYPFGLTLTSMGAGVTEQAYKYNGKELETKFDLQTYEYGARQYNSQIGRWNGVDPLAAKYFSISPFAYVANNPVKFVDPDGRVIMDASIKQTYPHFYNYVNNQLGNFFLGSPAILNALSKYSVGALDPATIKHAMSQGNGPNVIVADMAYGHEGEFVAETNTIKLSSRLVGLFNDVMSGNVKTTPNAKTGMAIALTSTFINEFTHYGDELDGIQANVDQNGNVFNDPSIIGDWESKKPYDEGNRAAEAVYRFSSGLGTVNQEDYKRKTISAGMQDLFLLRDGVFAHPETLEPKTKPNADLIDHTRIPIISPN